MQLPDGSAYDGETVGGELYGQGTRVYPNGDVYTGSFAFGERSGAGTFESVDGVSRYEGDWISNMYEGKGKLVRADGSQHEGAFVKHKPNGFGTATSAGGDRWTGHYVNGLLFDENGNFEGADGSTYQGAWTKHLRNGTGKGFDAQSRISYDGQWADDRPVHTARALFVYGGWRDVEEEEEVEVEVPPEEEGGEPTKEVKVVKKTRTIRKPLDDAFTVHAGETLARVHVALMRPNDDKDEEVKDEIDEPNQPKGKGKGEVPPPPPPPPPVVPLTEECGRRMAVSLYVAGAFPSGSAALAPAATFEFEEVEADGGKGKKGGGGGGGGGGKGKAGPPTAEPPPPLSVSDEDLVDLEQVALNGPEVLPEDLPPWGDEEKARYAEAKEAHDAKQAEVEGLFRVEGERDADAIANATRELVELAAALDIAKPPAWVDDPPPPYTAVTTRYARIAEESPADASTLAAIELDATVPPNEYIAVVTTELSDVERADLQRWHEAQAQARAAAAAAESAAASGADAGAPALADGSPPAAPPSPPAVVMRSHFKLKVLPPAVAGEAAAPAPPAKGGKGKK